MAQRGKQEEVYWFTSRHYGWGWRPVTWQAWLLLLAYLIIVVGSAIWLLPHNKTSPANYVHPIAFILIFLSATQLLVGICIAKGQRPSIKRSNKE